MRINCKSVKYGMERREQAEAMLRSKIIRKLTCVRSLMYGYLVAGAFLCVAAASALGQTGDTTKKVVVTLLLSDAHTMGGATQDEKDLTVAALGGVGFKEAKSWLYFDASALPPDVQEKDLVEVRLQLTPKEGALSGMAITVAPSRQKAPGDHTGPVSYSPAADPEWSTLVSPPLPTKPQMLELRSDSAKLTRGGLLAESGQRTARYIGLLLLPQPNASRRVYYGLSSGVNHPGRVPRLIVTYRRKTSQVSACAGEPSMPAPIQSDGREANTSSCNFLPRTDVPVGSDYTFRSYQVAADSRTKAPVVYRDRLYIVRKVGSATRLEELDPLGGLIASVPLDGEVRAGSPMVVDGFGRLRIITNDAIFTAQLSSNSPSALPASVDKKLFAFGQVPETVLAGPDGTLYIVKEGIFALNTDVGQLDKNGKVVRPLKLWEVALSDESSARITLSPDGHFLYALARFAERKSRFVAINTQTGKDVQLLPGKVSTAGKSVKWISGMNFSQTAVGQTIPVGHHSCTVETTSSTSLTCKEDLGTSSGVSWAEFPDNLNSFRNPVVARGLKGVDFVYLTGSSGSEATLWAVQNDPTTQDVDSLARFTGVWKYPLEAKAVVGQPILDSKATGAADGLAKKKFYFLQSFLPGVAGTPKLTAVSALDGIKVSEIAEPSKPAGRWRTDVNPLVDGAGNVVFWANNTLYGYTAETKSLFTASAVSSPPQLLFGPSGALYGAYGSTDAGTTVTALVPSFRQSDAGPTSLYSPNNLYVTGSLDRKIAKSWTLGASGSVVLGENFSVKMGETLAVRVNTNQ
jgi:hypothetical protein